MHGLLTLPDQQADAAELGKLVALAGVRHHPTRIKCATLSWHALHAALQDEEREFVSTE